MITRIIIFALIGGLVYLNYTTPKIEDHKALILAEFDLGYEMPEEMERFIWKDVDYSNFFVCSFMKTKEDSKMISSGYLEKVKLVNTQWVEDTKLLLQKRFDY